MLITIGAFDGFHLGHSQLLKVCRTLSPDFAVITFHPHPAQYMHKLTHTLFTLRERELFRRVLDIPHMYILEFNGQLMSLPPLEFWRLLRERFDVDGLVMGSDFHFAFNREGSAQYLAGIARQEGIRSVEVVDVIDRPELSSTNVRECVRRGDVESAARTLGCPYFMLGQVMHGKARGRTMHFPTANIDISGRLIPAEGVYSCAVLVGSEWHCGALSIGTNPTFSDVNGLRCEVFIMDFDGDIYGHELLIMYLGRVRGIQKFSGKDELMRRIAVDVEECRKIYQQSFNGDSGFPGKAREVYSTNDLKSDIIKLV